MLRLLLDVGIIIYTCMIIYIVYVTIVFYRTTYIPLRSEDICILVHIICELDTGRGGDLSKPVGSDAEEKCMR